MNKVISTHVLIRGKSCPLSCLKENSNIKVVVECSHGRREIRWSRRHQKCYKCVAETGAYNTSPKGRKITWGDKISEAKIGKRFSEDHRKSLSMSQYGVSADRWPGFYEKSEIHKLRDSLEYRDFVRKVMVRDGFACQLSNRQGALNVHHIEGMNIALEKALDYSNVITLHEDVHKLFHDLYGRGDNTKNQFEEFRQRINSGELNV
jgi:hypothetical protein